MVGPLSTWTGVVLDANGRVTELFPQNHGVISGIISPSIGNLSELTSLKLNGNDNPISIIDLHGSIPAEIWKLTKLKKLQIKFTNVTGGIPAGIETMVSLEEINFQQSYLGGSIPAELFELPSLQKAYLHESNFTGTIPESIKNVNKGQFTRIYLMDNKLEGPLPFVDSLVNCKLQITGNLFSFADVKPYHDAAANYAAFSDNYQYAQETQHFSLTQGDAVNMDLTVKDGEAYAWFFNDVAAPISMDKKYAIASVMPDDQGTYVCKVQSNMVANFDIRAIFEIDTVIAVVTPDAPVLQSAVSSIDGNTVSLTFDIDIADPGAEATNFTFTEEGTAIAISSVALDGSDAKVVNLTLASTISSGNSGLKLSYTPGALQSTEGGKVEAFGPVDVANDSKTSVADLSLNLSVYPNPISDILYINSDVQINMIKVSDITGKTIIQLNNVNDNNIKLPLQNIESGMYILSVKSNQRILVKKIVKD